MYMQCPRSNSYKLPVTLGISAQVGNSLRWKSGSPHVMMANITTKTPIRFTPKPAFTWKTWGDDITFVSQQLYHCHTWEKKNHYTINTVYIPRIIKQCILYVLNINVIINRWYRHLIPKTDIVWTHQQKSSYLYISFIMDVLFFGLCVSTI